jgi:Protein of unknown function (DUF3024)
LAAVKSIWFDWAVPPPALDIAAIHAYCEQRVPPQALAQVRVEAVVQRNAVTIVERRAPWRAGVGPEWTTSPIARLRFVVKDRSWVLCGRDRNQKWHLYPHAGRSADVAVLLDEIDRDPTGIFWG